MEPARVQVVGLDHIVLVCPDVEASLAWYTGVLGLAGVRVDEWRRGETFFPSVRVTPTTIIDLFPAGDVSSPEPSSMPASAPSAPRLDHLCLVVEPTDLTALAARDDLDVVSGPTDGLFGAQGLATSLYVRDPAGITVELRSYA
jgi:catechol 2,3-dioxygenase-like lactoylglutathione lyase family enzyme